MQEYWRVTKRLIKSLSYRLPINASLREPAFIIGCGRSGTTILGELLSKHPAVAYLNEPHSIWFLDPQTDVWTSDAARRHGKLYLTGDDVEGRYSELIQRAFYFYVLRKRKSQLVEKLPINSFRLGYINEIFPDARFIHLMRNGADVARSIGKFGPNEWFGIGDYKWKQLVKLAEHRGETGLVSLCNDNFTKGLLEWRLSVSTALADLGKIPEHRTLELRYEGLVKYPEEIARSIEAFLQVPSSRQMEEFAEQHIRRKSAEFNLSQLSDHHLTIAGPLLSRLGYIGSQYSCKNRR